LGFLHETRGDRIADDVSSNRQDVFFQSDDVIEEALLPECLAVTLLELVSRLLLEALNKSENVRVVSGPENE